jgi:hypothetical protein
VKGCGIRCLKCKRAWLIFGDVKPVPCVFCGHPEVEMSVGK